MIVCSLVLVAGANTITKVSIIPFLIAGFAVLIKELLKVRKDIIENKKIENYEQGIQSDMVLNEEEKMKKQEKLLDNVYLFAFLTFWFGFLIFFDYLANK